MFSNTLFFLTNLLVIFYLSYASNAQTSPCAGLSYYVKNGDTVKSIVNSYAYLRVTDDALQAANPTINFAVSNLASYHIICLPINFPTSTPFSTPVTITLAPIHKPTPNAGDYCRCCSNYAILSGDTCYNLINKYIAGNSYNFYKANPYINCNNLQIGQRVCLPGFSGSIVPTVPNPPTSTCSRFYTVAHGDICHSISRNLGIHVKTLFACNNVVNSECTNLQPGQILRY